MARTERNVGIEPPPVIYQVYVDAFARGRSGTSPGRRRGGDLEGLVDRLDYIAELGVDLVWLTPIFDAPSDHGYNIVDYFRVDRRLVPDDVDADVLFERVVTEAHARGIGVLLDLPLNHVGHDYTFDHVPEEDRPVIRRARTRQERGWTRDLKYFDHDDEPTRRFLFEVARYWVERFAIDGYRYDYVHGIANPFWSRLYGDLKSLRDDLYFVGEHWEDMGAPEENARDIGSRFDGEAGPCFDTLFDFPYQVAIVESLEDGNPQRLVEILDLCDRYYPRPACAMLDNHDMSRIGDWAQGDSRKLGLCMRQLAWYDGPVSILYGTETGLRAGRAPRRTVDDSGRILMDWEGADQSLLDLSRRVLGIRREHSKALFSTTVHRGAVGGLFVELRGDRFGGQLLTVLNWSDRSCPVGTDISSIFEATISADALCRGERISLENGRLCTPIPPYGGGIYRVL